MNSQQTVSSTSSGVYITKILPKKRKIVQFNQKGDIGIGTFNQEGLVLELFCNISTEPTSSISSRNSSSFNSNQNQNGSMSDKSSKSDEPQNPTSNQPEQSDFKDPHTICRVLKTYKDTSISDFQFSKDFKNLFLVNNNELAAYCSTTFTLRANFKRLVGSKNPKKTKPNRKIIVLSRNCLLQYNSNHYQVFYFGKTLFDQKSRAEDNTSVVKANRDVYFKSLAKDTTLGEVSGINFDNFEHFEELYQDHLKVPTLKNRKFKTKRKCILMNNNLGLIYREFG